MTYLQSEALTPAAYLARHQRFTLEVQRGDHQHAAYVANPGRMHELLLPGVTVHLAPRPLRKLPWEALALSWHARWPGDRPRAVYLCTPQINTLAAALLQADLVPALAGYHIERAEVPLGHARSDFLLRNDRGHRRLLEVKSVTLVEEGLAMFPDATTARGLRHIAGLSQAELPATLWFIAQGPAQHFLPDLHNDLAFARALDAARGDLDIIACALNPTLDAGRLHFATPPRWLHCPWERLHPGLDDRGLYLLHLDVATPQGIALATQGHRVLAPGHYIYVGCAQHQLSATMAKDLRQRQHLRSPIDALRQHAQRARAFAIRGITDACALARDLATLGTTRLDLGPEPCPCGGHLFWAGPDDPVPTAPYQRLLTQWRHQRCFAP